MPWSSRAAFGFISLVLNPTILPKATRALVEFAGGLLWVENFPGMSSPHLTYSLLFREETGGLVLLGRNLL